jgi:hypothetical protein
VLRGCPPFGVHISLAHDVAMPAAQVACRAAHLAHQVVVGRAGQQPLVALVGLLRRRLDVLHRHIPAVVARLVDAAEAQLVDDGRE